MFGWYPVAKLIFSCWVCSQVLFSLTPWMAHQGRLPPRAPCAPLLDNADDDDDEGGGAFGGADDAKDAVDLRARLIEAGGASSSAEATSAVTFWQIT